MDARKQYSRLGWAYVVFLLVAGGVQALYVVTYTLLQFWIRYPLVERVVSFLGSREGMILISIFSMYACAFPVFWLMMRRIPSWHKDSTESICFWKLLVLLVVCLGVTYIGNLIGQGLMLISGLLTGRGGVNPVDDMILEMHPAVMILSTIVVAPVMEELMFRKLLIDRTVCFGQRTAVVLSGISFGLFHGNFYQFFYACALGMIFAYVYSSTGKLRYSIGLHMVINTIGGLVPLLLMRGLNSENPVAELAGMAGLGLLGLFMIAAMLAAIVLLCLFVRKLRWFQPWEMGAGMDAVRCLVRAPGVWVMVGLQGVAFLLGMIRG
ncbi:MAG: CPBP family intramembrane metalloprotease [Eubacteriales bacterium]|nr:CPBP family intramembrane metalloprotease [Eubacteriales bacterium]